jgi:hypothetical protein
VAEVTDEARRVLERAHQVAGQVGREAGRERAAVVRETDQVRAFRDGLLHDLGRVHGEVTGLLERTFTERHQALGASGAAPKAAAAPQAKANKPAQPAEGAKADERK